MSGPVRTQDVDGAVDDGGAARDRGHVVEVTPSHETRVGDHVVRRALPRRARRTVGAWCFLDHLGPTPQPDDPGGGIGPHPHIGLQTVTWLVEGSLLHRDSLGSEQEIRPGQLNLMTAGRGVAHAEESLATGAGLHGVQLWVAQPERTRWGAPAFEHHATLPRVELGAGIATVLVGEVDGVESPARTDTELVGAELDLRRGTATVPVRAAHEHAAVVLTGSVTVDGRAVSPGALCYLGTGRDELSFEAPGPTRMLLVGGEPFEATPTMWWNFVGRTRQEIEDARRDWEDGGDRFGATGSTLPRIAAPPVPWREDRS